MSRLLTWVLRLLPLLGLALLLAGVGVFGALPDEWWDRKGFIVNVVSGVTTASFGVPIAFFVLQSLLNERSTARDKRQALGVARNNLLAIEAGLCGIVGIASSRRRTGPLVHEIMDRINTEAHENVELQRWLGKIKLSSPPVRGGRDDRLTDFSPRVGKALKRYVASVDSDDARNTALSRLADQTGFISERLVENGLSATSVDSASSISQLIVGLESRSILGAYEAARNSLVHALRTMYEAHERYSVDSVTDAYKASRGFEECLLQISAHLIDLEKTMKPVLDEIALIDELLRRPS